MKNTDKYRVKLRLVVQKGRKYSMYVVQEKCSLLGIISYWKDTGTTSRDASHINYLVNKMNKEYK